MTAAYDYIDPEQPQPQQQPQPMGYTTPALAIEALRLQRRKEQLKAQALAASQALGNMPKGQMVGNGGFQHYVAPHWSQQVAPVVKTALNQLDTGQLDQDQEAFDERSSAAARRHLASVPPDTAPMEVKLQWAQQGAQIPALAPTMQQYLNDQLVMAPERAENRAWRSSEAEANRQARAEQAEAQREFQRWQTGENNALRREIAASKGGSVDPDSKASNWKQEVASDGSIVYRNIISGNVRQGGQGKPTAATEKAQADAATSVQNAKDGLAILESMKPLFGKATESGLRADIEKAWSYGTGHSTDAQANLKDLGIKAANLAKYADRKMFGPQFTDADVKAIKESVGNFQNATSYKDRMAAYNAVKEIFERQARVPTTFSQDTSNRKAANAPGGGLPRVSSDADFDALPSGARFMDPNGQVRTKP